MELYVSPLGLKVSAGDNLSRDGSGAERAAGLGKALGRANGQGESQVYDWWTKPPPIPLRRVAKGKGLLSSRKASKRIYETATMVALKGHGEGAPAIRSAVRAGYTMPVLLAGRQAGSTHGGFN